MTTITIFKWDFSVKHTRKTSSVFFLEKKEKRKQKNFLFANFSRHPALPLPPHAKIKVRWSPKLNFFCFSFLSLRLIHLWEKRTGDFGESLSILFRITCHKQPKKESRRGKLQFYMVDLFFCFPISLVPNSLESERELDSITLSPPAENSTRVRKNTQRNLSEKSDNNQRTTELKICENQFKSSKSHQTWSGAWHRHSSKVARSTIDSPSRPSFHATLPTLVQQFSINSVPISVNSSRNIHKKVFHTRIPSVLFVHTIKPASKAHAWQFSVGRFCVVLIHHINIMANNDLVHFHTTENRKPLRKLFHHENFIWNFFPNTLSHTHDETKLPSCPHHSSISPIYSVSFVFLLPHHRFCVCMLGESYLEAKIFRLHSFLI